MSRLLDDDLDDIPQRERELTLSTGAILAIFLGLVLLCGVFFGFGYNLGRKSTSAASAALPVASTDAEPAAADNASFDNFKPAPGSPSKTASDEGAAVVPAASSTETAQPVAATVRETPAPTAAETHAAPTPVSAAPHAAASTMPRSMQTPAPVASASGSFVVQVAAISSQHKDDADLLANALHSKGYDVAERTESQDKLIHIQVGPFATKADAEAMRERLIVDGYNAIVK